MRVVRILGTLEPGGAQLSALQLSAALRQFGVATTLLAGDATPPGLELATRYGLPADAYRVSDILPPDSLQWTPEPAFASWLAPRLAGAALVHAHMMGAWWAAAQALPASVPLVASEHNQMSWPRDDHTPAARDAARRVDMFFAHGPAAHAWAARVGLDDGRLRDGRSSVEGLSARPLPGLPSPRLTFAGRLCGDKAPDVLIEALALIGAPPPAYLVGEGPLRGALTRLIRARGLGAVVHLPGWLLPPISSILNRALHDVLLTKDEYHAMAAGLAEPIIGTAVDGWRPPWARAAASSSARTRAPSPRRYRVSWAASGPTPAPASPLPASSPPAQRPPSTPAPTASCSPAAPDQESNRATALTPAPPDHCPSPAPGVPAEMPRTRDAPATELGKCRGRSGTPRSRATSPKNGVPAAPEARGTAAGSPR
jgi:hypothetical protein